MSIGVSDFTDLVAGKYEINSFYILEGRRIPAYLTSPKTIHDLTVHKTKNGQEIYEEQFGPSKKNEI